MKTSVREIKKQAYNRDRHFKVSIVYKFFRRIAVYCVWAILKTPITANMVTLLSILIILLASLFFAFGKPIYFALGLLLFYFGEFFDYMDGLVARCRKGVTKLQSGFLGRTYHHINPSFIFVGLGFGFYKLSGDIWLLYAGFAAGFFQLATGFLLLLKQLVILRNPEAVKGRAYKLHKAIPSQIGLANRKDLLLLKLASFPTYRLREITTVVLLLYFFEYNITSSYLIFYGLFVPLRSVVFFKSTYNILKKIEKKR